MLGNVKIWAPTNFVEMPLMHVLKRINPWMKWFVGSLWQLLIILRRIFRMKRMIICAFTEEDVHAKLAIIATEESQECPCQLSVFRNKGLWNTLSNPQAESWALWTFPIPQGRRLSDVFVAEKNQRSSWLKMCIPVKNPVSAGSWVFKPT